MATPATAAFGVIGSLIFVGLQVRQNSAGVRQSAVQAHITAYQELFSNVIDSAETAKIVRLGLQDADALNDTEGMRFYAFASKVMRIYQGLYCRRALAEFGCARLERQASRD